MRKWIKQPYGKNQCGQVAVAVIAGISLQESIKLVGKKGRTKTKDLATALRKLGFKCPDRCKVMPRPKLGIGHLNTGKKSGWHWVVIDGDKIFDGVRGDEFGNVYRWDPGWKLTSYLPIEESS